MSGDKGAEEPPQKPFRCTTEQGIEYEENGLNRNNADLLRRLRSE
jgi:hypothetical protein